MLLLYVKTLYIRPLGSILDLGFTRLYSRSALENRTSDVLVGSVGGGRGGRGGRGRKKGGKKGVKVEHGVLLGNGKSNVHWGGLSNTLSMNGPRYGTDWLQTERFGMAKMPDVENEQDTRGIFSKENFLNLRDLEGSNYIERRLSQQKWSKKGWTGRTWGGRRVGCPELANGTPVTDFSSIVVELKRVANQTKAGKKRTVSCLVVVGNGNGLVGFAVGRGEEVFAAIRKAKNKAVTSLQFIPRYERHTVYHDIRVKYCRTTVTLERKVLGSGLKCQRVISAICELAGIQNMRAKIVGSTNPLNVVQATMKGLTTQEAHQSLADEKDKFVVEFREESYGRPIVASVPKGFQTKEMNDLLGHMQYCINNDNSAVRQ